MLCFVFSKRSFIISFSFFLSFVVVVVVVVVDYHKKKDRVSPLFVEAIVCEIARLFVKKQTYEENFSAAFFSETVEQHMFNFNCVNVTSIELDTFVRAYRIL